jgi:hypothetical protein
MMVSSSLPARAISELDIKSEEYCVRGVCQMRSLRSVEKGRSQRRLGIDAIRFYQRQALLPKAPRNQSTDVTRKGNGRDRERRPGAERRWEIYFREVLSRQLDGKRPNRLTISSPLFSWVRNERRPMTLLI